ncbi:hypothetical protein VNO77_21175 [Canavalia gladiata]|uniref:Uncharacterized protein n=1 Tax=Canavalia gladiata TaxID=3824 RepID=A0AAN9LQZ1_CANGL
MFHTILGECIISLQDATMLTDLANKLEMVHYLSTKVVGLRTISLSDVLDQVRQHTKRIILLKKIED